MRKKSIKTRGSRAVCLLPACVGALFAPRATQSAGLRVGQINAALDYLRRQRVTCELSRLPESSSIVGRPGIRPTADSACFLVDVRADLRLVEIGFHAIFILNGPLYCCKVHNDWFLMQS